MKNKIYVIGVIVLLLIALSPLFGNEELRKKEASFNRTDEEFMIGIVTDTTHSESYDRSQSDGDLSARGEAGSREEKQQISVDSNRKVIYEYSISLATEKFDESRDSVQKMAKERGGFIESMEVSGTAETKNRQVHFQVRIPSDEAEAYFEAMKTLGQVTYENKTSNDVTRQYHDTEIEIKNLEMAEERYLALYAKAESIEEMLLLENEINRIRTQIDIKKASIKGYDYRVAFTLFYVNMTEVVDEKPSVHVEPTMWDRAVEGFIHTINNLIKIGQDLIVFVVSLSPVIAILVVLFLIVFAIYAIAKKRAEKRQMEDQAKSIAEKNKQ